MRPKKIKPEAWIEKQVLAWAFQNKWSLDVYDSKALFVGGKRKRNPGISVGVPDLMGNCNLGFAVYIELKKEGGDGICRLSQYNFLKKKIESNSFGVVVDSPDRLDFLYHTWLSLRVHSINESNNFLLLELPKKVIIKSKVYHLQEP